MRLEIDKNEIAIVPENIQDEAYIKHVLNIKQDGDQIILKRVNTQNDVNHSIYTFPQDMCLTSNPELYEEEK